MTKKRYIGLTRYLFTRMIENDKANGFGNFENGVAGRLFRGVENVDLSRGTCTCSSYQEAWDSLKPVRELYGVE